MNLRSAVETSGVIIAVASPPGRSARGIIRGSGRGAFDLLRSILEVEKNPIEFTRGASMVRLLLSTRFGPRHLPAVLLAMPRPRSYTGEDTFELVLPGNPVLLERVVDQLVGAGAAAGIDARRAEAGEFTARAFFNNRLSLTEAEGVAASIAASSDAELRAAQMLTRGILGDFAHRLGDDLANALALVEAGIDFTDQEDVVAIAPPELHARLVDLRGRIASHLERAVGFESLEAIPWVVLVGPPNAGKSTLFNALLGRERAVVSDVAGTTRDVLAEPLHLRGCDGQDAEIMLVDIAGLDDRDDASIFNIEMQRAARSAIERAELLLVCVPPNTGPDALFPRTWDCRVDGAQLPVATKVDTIPSQEKASDAFFGVSAWTGDGLEELKEAIATRLADRAVSLSSGAVALQPRHDAALREALASLDEAISLVEPQVEERSLARAELIASCMRSGLDAIAALAGDITPDEVLGRVFASFCVGK